MNPTRQEQQLAIEGCVLKKLTAHVDERGFSLQLIRSTDGYDWVSRVEIK